VIRVDFQDEQVQRSLRRYRDQIASSPSLMRSLSFQLRDYVRETMKMQGRKRPWAPLSQMTMLRTGRRKPLTPLVSAIKSSYTPTSVQVYFENPKNQDWTIEQHHKGYTIPAKVGRQGFYAARGGAPHFFMYRKSAKVPAREIIPTRAEINKVISGTVTNWINLRR
jgi:hypothetical protein